MTGIYYNMYHCIVSGSKRRGNSVSKWCLQGDSVHCAGPCQVGVYTSIFLFTLTYNLYTLNIYFYLFVTINLYLAYTFSFLFNLYTAFF